jgi:O-acetyl-ADP-ribose deacetylase (regulator of RNase III)
MIFIPDKRIELFKGDITQLNVDAVVNAANSSLVGGGGVDGAIHRRAGEKLQEECRRLRGCKTGEAKITKGYNLPAKWVIHTVGPIWRGGGENETDLLKSCYLNCLALTDIMHIETIAFPSISTGSYRFPLQIAAGIAVNTVNGFLIGNILIKKVIFVCYDSAVYDVYKDILIT